MTKPKDLVRYEIAEELGEHPITEREVIRRLMRLILDTRQLIESNRPNIAIKVIDNAQENSWQEMGWADIMKRDRDNKSDPDKFQSLIQWLIRYQEKPPSLSLRAATEEIDIRYLTQTVEKYIRDVTIMDVYREVLRLK